MRPARTRGRIVDIVATKRARWFAIGVVVALLLGSSGPSAAAQEFDVSVASVDELGGLTAQVAHSGDGVNLRAEPSRAADVIDTLSDGTTVSLRIDEADTVYDDDGTRWWPVRVDGRDGWIAGFYLDSVGSAPAADDGSDAPSAASSFGPGDYVAVNTDDGSGLNLRAGVGTGFERLGFIAEGDVVQVMDAPDADDNGDAWLLVTTGDVVGWAFAAYLVAASQPDAPADEPTFEAAEFGRGDYVTPADGDGVNVRTKAGTDGGRIATLGAGDVVQIVKGAVYDDGGAVWYKIDDGDISGYVLGALMTGADGPPGGPTGGFIYPLADYVFTQAFGCTGLSTNAYNANLGCLFHDAIDLAAPAYTPLLASDGGVVVAAGWCDCGLGYYVEIDHQNGFSTIYGHMAEQPYVAVGQAVNQGDVIGPVGSTGHSTGPHVHFTLKRNGVAVDPLGYL